MSAIEQGAGCIYETDDDNAPNEFWQPRTLRVAARTVEAKRWLNVYRVFSDEKIWPRGFPLEDLAHSWNDRQIADDAIRSFVDAPIQQGLADLAPDVDAIWRLTMDKEVVFDRVDSVMLAPNTWCPFNSQSTWFWPVAYPLLYLPSYCSFRMLSLIHI